MALQSKRQNRCLFIDSLRGMAMLHAVAYHFLFDVFIIYGLDPDWYRITGVFIWQQCICWTFILVSGLSWPWGRRPLRRGLELNVWGLVVTAVTLAASPKTAIWFGILNFMGCAMLLMIPLRRLLERISPAAGMAGSFLLFLLFRYVQRGEVAFGLVQLPDWLYTTRILTPLGFPYDGFRSSDYFPILPWFFLYVTGYFLGRLLTERGVLDRLARVHHPALTWVGQNSIWVYLVHQPVCMGVCMLIFR